MFEKVQSSSLESESIHIIITVLNVSFCWYTTPQQMCLLEDTDSKKERVQLSRVLVLPQ